MLTFQIDKNTNFSDLSNLESVMVAMQKSMEHDDLSQPSAEEARLLFGLYQTAKMICQVMPFAPFVTAYKRLEPIHQELENVANGTATEEDWDELMWQNTFATKPEIAQKLLLDSVSALSQDSLAKLWDNEEDSFWDKYATKA